MLYHLSNKILLKSFINGRTKQCNVKNKIIEIIKYYLSCAKIVYKRHSRNHESKPMNYTQLQLY